MEMQMPHYLPKWESLKKQDRLQNHGTPVCPSHTNGPEANTSSSISKYRPSLSPHSSISSPCSWRGTRVGVNSSVFDSHHIEVSNLVRTSSILPQQSNPISQKPIWLPPKYLLFLDMAYDPTRLDVGPVIYFGFTWRTNRSKFLRYTSRGYRLDDISPRPKWSRHRFLAIFSIRFRRVRSTLLVYTFHYI